MFVLRSKLASPARENSLWVQQVLRQRNFLIVWVGSGKHCQVQCFIPTVNLLGRRGPKLKSMQLRRKALIACFSSKAQDHSSNTELEDGEKKSRGPGTDWRVREKVQLGNFASCVRRRRRKRRKRQGGRGSNLCRGWGAVPPHGVLW